MSFSKLGLSPKVLAVRRSEWLHRAHADPGAGASRTCSRGATCSASPRPAPARPHRFVLPMLTLLEKGRARARMPRTLILEPTRELAAQVEENFNRYGRNHKLTVALLIGGVSFDDQEKKLDRGVDVLIATPGRLLDHVRARQAPDDRRRDPRHRRSRPHARHGLHPRHRAHLQAPPLHPPDAVLLGHHAAGDPAPRRHVPVQSGARRGVAAGRPPPTVSPVHRPVRARAGRQARRPARAHPRRDRLQERDHLLQPQARRRHARSARSSRHGFSVGALHGDMDQRSRMADARRLPQGPARRFSSPATSPRAASTSRRSATSSISTCRPMPRTTSTASAAPAAPG